MNGITVATNGTHAVTLTPGTVAFCNAANTLHLLIGTGQATKSRAPMPLKCQAPPAWEKGPVDAPGGIEGE